MAGELQSPASITPAWPAPANVHALTTLRTGGYSGAPYASFNLATHTGDDAAAVDRNRALLRDRFSLPSEPVWLRQVHSNRVVSACPGGIGAEADGSWTGSAGCVCAVMTADCLPVLICNREGSRVAAVHAGWRGLHAGVVTNAVRMLESDPAELMVWLGPAIGPRAFEVGAEVFQAFADRNDENTSAFRRTDVQHWLCDLYQLARIELFNQGVTSVFGGNECTFTDEQRFYSYRRDGETGRMASLIWLADQDAANPELF
jgi:YfiH family protein